jgi:hypothetical protein
VPHVYSIISNAAFSPDTVKMMGIVFDDAWASLEPEYEEAREDEIALARLALAKAVVLFAGLGNRDAEQLKAKALRVLKMPNAA